LEFVPEEQRALVDLHEFPAGILPPSGAIATAAQQGRLSRDLAEAAEQPREGSNAAGVATSQPPFYYALEAIPYGIGSSGSLLTRLELMRLMSALYAGVTALFAFLFVREVLPARRMAWVTGGLSVAFAPLLGFMSGSVNPDSLLFAVSAAVFWGLAYTFRRGLTYRRAIMIGAITAAGVLTKLNFVGLFPGVIAGLGVLAWHLIRTSGRRYAYRAFALGASLAASPIILYAIVNAVAGHSTFGVISGATSTATHHGSIFAAASYIWQVFLPRLPGMTAHFRGIFTTQQIWFDGLVGQFGWAETAFPEWVYELAGVFGLAVLVACARVLVAVRDTAKKRWDELVVYATMSLGLLILVGGASYISRETELFTEARYLLPLLPLLAAGVGLAIRVAGRRREAVLATIFVLAIVADSVFSQLLVIGRFYS
jgi:4-amino-4-deoxy-L-arabinose transferase-like glycosyltransferase